MKLLPSILSFEYHGPHGTFKIDEITEVEPPLANDLIRIRIADQWQTVMKQRVLVSFKYCGALRTKTYYQAEREAEKLKLGLVGSE